MPNGSVVLGKDYDAIGGKEMLFLLKVLTLAQATIKKKEKINKS